MKKYIIKDSLGNKKIVYAENVVDALTFIDSKVKDAYIAKIDNDYIEEVDGRQSTKPELTSFRKYAKKFTSKKEAIDYARKYFRVKPFEIDIINVADTQTFIDSKVKDDVVSNYFYFDLDDMSMSLDNAINIMKNCGLTIVKINKHGDEAEVYYRGTSTAEQKAADKLDIFLD